MTSEPVSPMIAAVAEAMGNAAAAHVSGKQLLRVATYNIHKGVQGVGPTRRLEIHNLSAAIQQLDADIVCLQEVRKMNRREEMYFTNWPKVGQAEYLAPQGYEAIYRTNAITKDGEHGNALLSRWPVRDVKHLDVSDHRFEQRGLLHAEVLFHGRSVHTVVVHLGLIGGSRVRQIHLLHQFIEREVPPGAPVVVAGDFNDWGSHIKGMLAGFGLHEYDGGRSHLTYPSVLPLAQLDHVYVRGMEPLSLRVPQGKMWRRMSDHLPLIAEFHL